jgi:small nuclear ribonucleoprotein (snRNP)-like protein
MKEALKKYLKKRVVLDTRSSFLYIGKLEKVLDACVELSDVDVHDSRETTTSKEVYVLESKKTGIKANRDRVFINLDYVISFSGLDEVKVF